MGIVVIKNDDESKLQQRINESLRARAQSERLADDPDLAEGTEYVKDLKKTSRFGWIWIVLILLAILSLVFIVFL